VFSYDLFAQNWELVLFGAVAAAALCLCGAVFIARRLWSSRQYEQAQTSLEFFAEELRKLRRKCSVLELYVNEYFHTMNAAGWSELKVIAEQLAEVQLGLEEMQRCGKYSEVMELVALLTDQLSSEDESQAKRKFFAYSGSCGWRAKSNQLLNAVMEALEESANKTREVGVSRNRLKPTLVALADIKSL
jgi:hypothetical protein